MEKKTSTGEIVTESEFNYIWHNKVVANDPWSFGAKREATRKLYYDTLKSFNKDFFAEAVDRLIVDAAEKDWNGLPGAGEFLKYCQWVEKEKGVRRKVILCPCCKGDTWIRIPERDVVMPCDCNQEFKTTISQICRPDKKCETGECEAEGIVLHRGMILKTGICPKGPEHYKEYRSKVGEEVK